MNSPETEAGAVARRLKSVIDYVHDCERRVALGEIMELEGLDGNIVEICDAIAALPGPEAEALEPQMGILIEKLESLAQAMKEQQERVLAEDGEN